MPAAAVSTLVTNPVTFAPIYYAAYNLGVWVTGGNAAATPQTPPEQRPDTEGNLWLRLTSIGLPLLVGLAITATIAGAICYMLTNLGWYWLVMRRRRKIRQT